LFTQSVAILERRAHKIGTQASPEASELLPPRPRRTRGYKPLTDRIDETRRRKERFVEEVQIDQEEKFREDHPFRPQINPESRQVPYPRNHFLQKRPPNPEIPDPKPRQAINPKSKEIASKLEQQGADFLTRQSRQQRRAQSVERSATPRRLTQIEVETINERLSKPRALPARPIEVSEQNSVRRKADPKSIDRLVADSVRKAPPPSDPPRLQSLMDEKSRQMTRDVEPDLFQESLELHERQRRRAEEIRQWQELADITSYTCQTSIRREPLIPPRKRAIAGVEEFLERMSKKPKAPEEEVLARPKPVVIAHPFSFETRHRKSQQRMNEDVESVLSEINQLLLR
jgi:hypothetical protein